MTSIAANGGLPALRDQRTPPGWLAGLALIIGATAFGLIAGDMVAAGHAVEVVALVVVVLPVALWKRPSLGPVLLVSSAVLIEQVGQAVVPVSIFEPGVGTVVLTPNIPITSSIPLFQGLGSLHLEPADLLLLMVGLIYCLRTGPATRAWPRSHVSRAVGGVLGAVVLGLFLGLAHHGALRVAFMESRPYVYFASTYILTAVLIRTRAAIRTVLWAFVICAGLKAAQAFYIFMQVRNWHPRPVAVLGHEDAYTFGLFIILVAALWIFEVAGPLRKTATWLLPVVIAANMFNNRRAAWLLMGGGLIALAVISYRTLPSRRHLLKRTGLVLLVFSAGYLPAYWNKTGTLAQPARAIHSQISPNLRDAASDLYRVQEDANLKWNIRQAGVLGTGLGVPIDYALPIVDISKSDENIKYVPHNGVLYIPMKLGLLGTIAMWSLLGTGIVAGCRLARSIDREIAVVGAIMACALVAYALEGGTDEGFFFYRIAFMAGTMVGLGEAARRIQRNDLLSRYGGARAQSTRSRDSSRAITGEAASAWKPTS